MLEIASQMILCLLLAALLGFIIGYLFGKNTCESDICEPKEETINNHTSENNAPKREKRTENIETDHNAQKEEQHATNSAPTLLSGPRNGEKDNLTRIKGIGVKIDEMLNDIGIYHFDQIANWTEENIAWADQTLGFPGRAKRENWVEQASALAAGEETEFSKRVDAGNVASSKKA